MLNIFAGSLQASPTALTLKIYRKYICRQKIYLQKIFAGRLQASPHRPHPQMPDLRRSCTQPSAFWGSASPFLHSVLKKINFLNKSFLELTLLFLGHCCYSCRAFFRRSTKRKEVKGSLRYKSQDKIFQTIFFLVRCRSGVNNCVVTEEKRNCISCRYDKCIKAGMKVSIIDISKIAIMT